MMLFPFLRNDEGPRLRAFVAGVSVDGLRKEEFRHSVLQGLKPGVVLRVWWPG
jgi:hypothetical protein